MGLLLKQPYWAEKIHSLAHCRPGHSAMTSPAQTTLYLGILCQAFSDLAGDPALRSEIAIAFAVMGVGSNHPPETTPSFFAFIEVYEHAEREWLMQSGVDLDAAVDIIEAIRPTYESRYDFNEGPDRIVGRIQTAAKVCCHEETRFAAVEEQRVRAKEMRGVFSGIVTVSVNIAPPVGAALAQMPWLTAALGPLAGYSAKSGLDAIVRGTKRWF